MAAEDGQLDASLNDSAAGEDSSQGPPRARMQAFDEPSLAELLTKEPYCFSFFAALQVLAQVAAKSGAVNEEPRSAVEQIRFRAHQSLSFPASELWELQKPGEQYKPAGGKSIAEMTVAFLGLTGSMGTLPRPYTELVMQRIRKGDHALRDFLDIFNHRLIQAFAQAGAKYRFYFNYAEAAIREQPRQAQGEQKLRAFFLEERPALDLFSQILLDLGGLGTGLLRYKDSQRSRLAPRHEIPDSVVRYYSGPLGQTHRCAISLARMVADYFQVAAEIVPFVGQWIQLPVEHQSCLLRSRSEGDAALRTPRLGQSSHPRLGRNAVVGSRVFEVQGHFRVRLGPLTFDQFERFMPIGEDYQQLAQFVRLYAGPTYDFDIQLVLQGPEVPWCQIGAKGSRAPRLGWNTWLRNRDFLRTVDDATFRVPDAVSMSN